MQLMDRLADTGLLKHQGYVDGAWVGADQGRTYAVEDPATGVEIGQVADMGGDETRRAIAAAEAAWPAWRKKTAKERAAILRKWFDLMMAHQRDLAIIMTAEQGKPLAEAMGEIAYGASFVEWFAEEAKRAYGDVIPHHQDGKRILVIKQPIGVVAAITPWNFPHAMITRKCAPALAAGCPVVIKPAPATPYSALALAELAERAGIPKGVFNIIVSDRASEVGTEMATNPAVRKLGFTGSTGVGKLLMQQAAGTVKKVSLELGGNAPLIIFDDADLDRAVEGAIACKYRNAGQTCVCTNRIFVQDGVYRLRRTFRPRGRRDETRQWLRRRRHGRPDDHHGGGRKGRSACRRRRRPRRPGGRRRRPIQSRRTVLSADDFDRGDAQNAYFQRGNLWARGALVPVPGRGRCHRHGQ